MNDRDSDGVVCETHWYCNRAPTPQGTIQKSSHQQKNQGWPPAKETTRPSASETGTPSSCEAGEQSCICYPTITPTPSWMAAQDEDIEPLGTRGHTTSIPLFLGDLYVGEVNYPPNGNQRTVKAIQRNVNNYTAPAAPTASTPPTLSQLNSSISPSLQSSRRPRRILLDCYDSPPAQSADEWLLNNPSMRCLIGAVNASCTTTTDNETHAQHIIATYPFPLPPSCPGAENQDRFSAARRNVSQPD